MEPPENRVPAEADPIAAARFTNASTWELAPAQWSSAERKALVCCRVSAETHDVKTFVFRAEDGLPFSFEPGQFITISVQVNGEPLSRCYTISSPPTRPHTLSITVKRVPGGAVSNWLHDNLRPGAVAQVFGPSGMFTPASFPAKKLLYLSAGSGITPLMSMTRSCFDLGLDADIVFVHSARTPADIIYRRELAMLAAEPVRLRVAHVCEDVGDEAGWDGPLGRLSLELLQQLVPDYQEREVFTCGPAGYMAAAKNILQRGGHAPSKHHQESFDFGAETGEPINGTAMPTPAAAPLAAEGKYTIRLARSGKIFTMEGSENILAAAKRAGAVVASSCSQGMCGTCKTSIIAGSVDMRHNGGIRQREIDKGLCLICCSKPKSDLVLDL